MRLIREQEQEWSLEQSSQLNDAYRTLKDPIKRTEYLLRLEGVEIGRAIEDGDRSGAREREARRNKSFRRTCWKKSSS